MTAVSFTTIAQPNPGGVLFVEIPETVVKKLGAGKRVPVRVTLNGAKYRSTIAVYGGRYYLPARKEVRDAAKLVPGGRARVSLEVDTAPRTVDVPADLARALSAAKLRSGFDAISFSHSREFVEWITSASARRPDRRVFLRSSRRFGPKQGPARPSSGRPRAVSSEFWHLAWRCR